MTIIPDHIFFFGGQSNLEGVPPLPSITATDPRLVKWWDAQGWVPAGEPSQPGKQYSFSTSFCLRLLERMSAPYAGMPWQDYTIGIVNVAVGGSEIAQWQRGQTVYSNALARIQAAMAAAPGAIVAGGVFYQGESDTLTVAKANLWPPAYYSFMNSIRVDLGYDVTWPPMVYAQIGPKPNAPQDQGVYPGWETLQTLQSNYSLMFTNNRMFTAVGLPVMPVPNEIHLNTDGVRRAGIRAADVFFNNGFVATN